MVKALLFFCLVCVLEAGSAITISSVSCVIWNKMCNDVQCDNYSASCQRKYETKNWKELAQTSISEVDSWVSVTAKKRKKLFRVGRGSLFLRWGHVKVISLEILVWMYWNGMFTDWLLKDCYLICINILIAQKKRLACTFQQRKHSIHRPIRDLLSFV